MNEMLEFWRISKEKCFCIRAEGAERVIDWLLVVSLLDSNGRCNEVTLVFFLATNAGNLVVINVFHFR